jgi:hypothetical protein
VAQSAVSWYCWPDWLLHAYNLCTAGVQFILYALFGNNMIAFSFLLSCIFPSSRTATVFAYLLVFGSGLVGSLLLSQLANAGLWYADLLEFIPSLALYRYVRIRLRAFCCKGMDARADAPERMIYAWMGMIPAAAMCCNPSPKALHHACA